MNFKILILLALISSALLSGCLKSNVSINETKLNDQELINSFCQDKGYDSGLSEAVAPLDFWSYRKQHPYWLEDTGKGEIVCIKTTTSNDWFDYNDFYRWVQNI